MNNNKTSKNNNKNRDSIINKIKTNNNQFIYLSLSICIIVLFITFIYYEFYYIKKINNKKKLKYDNNKIVLLDKINNKGKSYYFKQEFGTDVESNVVINKDGMEITNYDKYISYPKDNKINNIEFNNITISIDIKLPYIYSNKEWNNTYQSYKPIIKFGSSPIISYNPYKHQLILSILYKDNPNTVKVKNIYINDIYIEKWMNIIFVIENRKIKIYSNKKLIKYDILDGVPILNLSDNYIIKMGQYKNNFNGLINNITLYLKTFSTKEIENL